MTDDEQKIKEQGVIIHALALAVDKYKHECIDKQAQWHYMNDENDRYFRQIGEQTKILNQRDEEIKTLKEQSKVQLDNIEQLRNENENLKKDLQEWRSKPLRNPSLESVGRSMMAIIGFINEKHLQIVISSEDADHNKSYNIILYDSIHGDSVATWVIREGETWAEFLSGIRKEMETEYTAWLKAHANDYNYYVSDERFWPYSTQKVIEEKKQYILNQGMQPECKDDSQEETE